MSKRHARVSQELDIKEKRLQAISEEDKKYARTLEAERDQLLEQLKKRQSECAELEEQKSSLQDRLCEQTEREKHIVLFLIEERKNILAQMQEVNKHLQDASSSITGFVRKGNSIFRLSI
jgi:chromosome segregation ATPase